jgi:hypothetical protein
MIKYLINTASLSPKILIVASTFIGASGLYLLSKNLSILIE